MEGRNVPGDGVHGVPYPEELRRAGRTRFSGAVFDGKCEMVIVFRIRLIAMISIVAIFHEMDDGHGNTLLYLSLQLHHSV